MINHATSSIDSAGTNYQANTIKVYWVDQGFGTDLFLDESHCFSHGSIPGALTLQLHIKDPILQQKRPTSVRVIALKRDAQEDNEIKPSWKCRRVLRLAYPPLHSIWRPTDPCHHIEKNKLWSKIYHPEESSWLGEEWNLSTWVW